MCEVGTKRFITPLQINKGFTLFSSVLFNILCLYTIIKSTCRLGLTLFLHKSTYGCRNKTFIFGAVLKYQCFVKTGSKRYIQNAICELELNIQPIKNWASPDLFLNFAGARKESEIGLGHVIEIGHWKRFR